MYIWVIGILFFAITFVPRFFTFMNFGYGFSDLGLYSQFLAALSHNILNPVIPSYGQTFLALKPQPFLYLLWPLSFVTTSPAVILFLDAFFLVIAAGACARLAARKAPHPLIVDAIFFAVLFSPLTLESLHAPTRITIWAQAPLALLLAEYAQKRELRRIGMWFGLLCLMDLNFGALGLLLFPLLMMTKRKRWNLQRRFMTALPVGLISILSLVALKFTGHALHLDYDFFFQTMGGALVTWLVCFWGLQMISLDLVAIGLALLVLRINGYHDVSLLVPIGACAALNGLEILEFKEDWIKKAVAGGFVASTLYWNLVGADVFFTPWRPEHYRILPASKIIHDTIAEIPPDSTVLASDSLSPELASRLNLSVIGTPGAVSLQPNYVLAHNEPTPFDHDGRYKLTEINSQTGTRLFKRIK